MAADRARARRTPSGSSIASAAIERAIALARAGRRGRRRRQGPRALPGVRGRPQGALRRRRRRPRGAACARGRLSRSRRPPAGGSSRRRPHAGGPARAVIDSRAAGPGDLFVGLVGEHVDGGRFAAAGAGRRRVGRAGGARARRRSALRGDRSASSPPTTRSRALQRLATAWRRALGCPVVGITGSVGKTSTKDILAAMLAQRLRTVANRENLNTEIGLPMTVLEAPAGTEALVLEMGMRGPGQIAELTAIAEPDVGLITAVAPGPPRAHGLDRGDRGGQGRARGRPAPGRDRDRARRARRCSTPIAATTSPR